MKTPVTYLFVPGNRPERFDKAAAAGADAVIIDLEDAVPAAEKAAAREAIAHWYQNYQGPAPVLVRINDDTTAWFETDCQFLRTTGIRGVVLPKAEYSRQIAPVKASLPADGYIVPIVETARGIANLNEIATAPGVQRLAFGTLDYIVDMELSGDERGLLVAATQIAFASRLAGLLPPVAGVTAAINDESQLAADIGFARATGFTAKLCIHPKQVAGVRAAMAPTAAEIDWARRVMAATAGGAAAVQVDGKMVDRPVILRAQSILDRA